jgi:hypothetical protein
MTYYARRVSDQHVGVRRRAPRFPFRRVVPLVAGLAMVVWALALGEPARPPAATQSPIVVPTWSGPDTVDLSGALVDGSAYTPRLYVAADTSVGVAVAADGSLRVVLARSPGSFTELHARPAADAAQVGGFAIAGDTVVWMETTTRGSSLWRASLAAGGPAAQVTTDTGEISFSGLPTEVQLRDGEVRWTARASGSTPRTELRSVQVTGGRVSWDRVDGELLLSAPPWAVSVPGGPGSPVVLRNLDTDETTTLTPAPNEAATCSPTWCRNPVPGTAGLAGVDILRPDGTDRRTVAGPEATPTAADAVLLDRYVPLAIDRDDGVGLSVYDIDSGKLRQVALRAADVGGRGGILWWSTGLGTQLTWHALDLSRLT